MFRCLNISLDSVTFGHDAIARWDTYHIYLKQCGNMLKDMVIDSFVSILKTAFFQHTDLDHIKSWARMSLLVFVAIQRTTCPNTATIAMI